jgi:hypothetical protein
VNPATTMAKQMMTTSVAAFFMCFGIIIFLCDTLYAAAKRSIIITANNSAK